MNQAHYHLILNHFPIIIPILGFLVMAGGFVFHSEVVKRTAFFIFIFGAICTVPTFVTGEGAEEVIKNLSGINEKFIENHADTAQTFAILSYLLGLISVLGLWSNWKQRSFSELVSYLTILFCIVVLFFAKQTGTTGGEIRHTEIIVDSSKPANK